MSEIVRVRFAPSPTGHLHVGGARTALFNFLLARRAGGTFVVRIEDTDRTRNLAGAADELLDDLCWLGLHWDEGPRVGGAFGPYFQSERLELYEAHARRLLDEGKAYYAFDTREELEALRAAAQREKRRFRYPRPTRFPSRREADAARAAGRPVVVRFRMPERDFALSDAILGEVRIAACELDDFVILKADGWPTYHFAVVVDDELMRITHVLRGQEHLMNTPNHVALQEALGFRTPVYAHLPIILNMDGSKMSKRDKERAAQARPGGPPPEIDIHDFRASGYLPEALVNFIALLGWSPGGDREKMTLEEMCALFSVERVGRTNARFDREKLLNFNTTALSAAPRERRLAALRDYIELRSRAGASTPLAGLDDATLLRLLEINPTARVLRDVEAKCGVLFAPDEEVRYDPDAVEKVLRRHEGAGLSVLRELHARLAALPDFAPDAIESVIQSFAAERGLKLAAVAQPLRVAVTGTTVSPPIFDTLALLGRERTVARIERTLRLHAGL